jgi:peptidoglycan hydrolase-like protein with peptidoglycan-binding domain
MRKAVVICLAAALLAGAGGRAHSQSGAVTPATIRSIQNELGRLGYYAGPMDGKLTAPTADAIRRYEHDKGLPQDGQASSRLWSFMQQASTQQPHPPNRETGMAADGTPLNPNGTHCCR